MYVKLYFQLEEKYVWDKDETSVNMSQLQVKSNTGSSVILSWVKGIFGDLEKLVVRPD